MIHWLNAKRVSWRWDRRPHPALLTPDDFLVLAALDRNQAREADLLSPHLPPALPTQAIQEALGRLMRHGLVHQLSRGGHIRYKLSRAGDQFLADAGPKR